MSKLTEKQKAKHLFTRDLARMTELLHRDHGGCEEEGCSLAAAMEAGDTEALTLWYESGAADPEFTRLYEKHANRIRTAL